jgi:hypothetical protein
MTEIRQPIAMRPAVLYGAQRKSPGMLLLYPEKLVHVESWITSWCTGLGFLTVAVLSAVLAHAGPGAVGGAIGAGGGAAIGAAITRRRAPRSVAAAGSRVTTIWLDSVTNVAALKTGRLAGKRIVVSTSGGIDYVFRANLDQWSADLAGALGGRGRNVQPTAAGLSVLSGSGA